MERLAVQFGLQQLEIMPDKTWESNFEMLDYEKIISGTLKIKTRMHDINKLTKQIIEIAEENSYAKNVTFELTSSSEPIYALVNEHRFDQILQNLLSNAAKLRQNRRLRDAAKYHASSTGTHFDSQSARI
jgi:signal transduction histidine kinase